MSLFGTSAFSPRAKRRSSFGFLPRNPENSSVSFGLVDFLPADNHRDSLALPKPTVANNAGPGSTGGVDWRRRRSSGLGFWNDIVDGDETPEAVPPPPSVALTGRKQASPPKKRRKVEDFSDYGKIKLGDIRRKQLKTAVSDACKHSLEMRSRVLEIGKIKEASVGDLFRMAEVCNILDFALGLAEDRLAKKHHKH